MTPLLYIVIPCFNNGEIIPFSVKFYKDKIEELSLCGKISGLSKILLIDNGSTDNTWERITDWTSKNSAVLGIRLGSYSGKTNAVICGIENVKRNADIIIVGDCQCRKDINAIDRMIDEYEKGSLIVFGKEEKSRGFERINRLIHIRKSRFDFGYFLISKDVMDELVKYTEYEIDLKKILLGMNFKASCVYYKKRNTFALKEKFTFKRVKEGYFAFFNTSHFPIHLVFIAGTMLSIIFFGILMIELLLTFFGKDYETSKILVLLLSSVDVAAAGIIGEYLIKIINEIKKHPRYTIIEITKAENNSVSAV